MKISSRPRDASITVSLQTPADGRWSGALPVEVRDCDNLVLAARGVSDGRLELPAGRYLVTAMLPSGEGVTMDDIVEVRPGEQKQVHLSVADLALPAKLEDSTTRWEAIKQFALPVSNLFASREFALLRANLLEATMHPPSGGVPRQPTARSSVEVRHSPVQTWLEISSKEGCTYVAIPVDEGKSTTMQWRSDAESGELHLGFDLHDGETNAFLDFIQNDRPYEARSIGQSIVAQSEQYMQDKGKSPLRAILGAYVLLRANELEGMGVWTSNLIYRCDWLPDVLAVRVEYLARNGEHADAVKLLLDAPRWGAPWFRSGIGYLENRAKVYASVAAAGKSGLSLAAGELEMLRRIAALFGELAAHLDMDQVTTVFRNMPRLA